MPINIEIKARSNQQGKIRKILQEKQAVFEGTDHQIDTYFKVNNGRMKLREGTIEHNLIHYERQDQKGPKQARILLYRPEPDSSLKALLKAALGVWTIVDKQREIYFIDNVKFHLDTVKTLGTFVEIEAIDSTDTIGTDRLHRQCNYFLHLFDIKKEDLMEDSYSDMANG